MNNLKFNVLIVVGMLCLCFSCKDDEGPRGGSFILDGQEYRLSTVLTQNYASGDDYYAWTLALSTSGLKFDETLGWYTGKGELVLLALWSYGFRGKELPEDVYVNPDVPVKSLIASASVRTGYDGNSSGGLIKNFSEAYVIVKKKDKVNYEIEFSMTRKDTGDEIAGTYTGPVEIVEFAE